MPRITADVYGSFNRGRAGGHASRGDYEGAERAAALVDPELAGAYGALGDRSRARFREQEADSANRTYAGAIARNDFGAAESAAAKVGNVEGVMGARGAATQLSQQQRTELWRGAQRTLAELEQIDASQGQGYAEWRARGLQALQQNPQMDPQMRGLIEGLPEQYSPNVTAGVRTFAERLRDGLLTPEQAVSMEMTGRQRDIQDRNADIAERRATAAETTANAAMIRAERGPRTFGEAGLTGDQVRAEREFARDWRGVYNNFAEIRQSQERIETASAQGNSAGDLALVVAFTKMLDPGSVAREGEVALTQSAASALAQAQNFLPRLQQGNTLLPPQVRAQLVQVARDMYGNYEGAYNRLASDYGRTADSYGFDRSRVMMGYNGGGAGGGGDAPPQRPPNVPEDYIWDGDGWARPD